MNWEDFTVGEALPTDADELFALRCEEQRELYPDTAPYAEFERDFRNFLRESFACPEKLALVVRRGDSIVATAFLSIEHEPPQFCDNGCYAYLCNVYTRPEYRRRGLLARLYAEALLRLKASGASALYCDTRMPVMERFLEQRGWVRRHDYFTFDLQ